MPLIIIEKYGFLKADNRLSMISITKLYCGGAAWGDFLRYGENSKKFANVDSQAIQRPETAEKRRPVVVWNVTRRCNLSCLHCYSDSADREYPDELNTAEGKQLLSDLAQFKVPVVLFSGGEPLMRDDIFDLLSYAQTLNLRTVISTNGTLIDNDVARTLKEVGVAYVGISLDGIGEVNDRFRGRKGAFGEAVSGIEACARAGLKVGLRMTLTRHNLVSLKDIFSFVREMPVDRICFYHLVYSGRGRKLKGDELTYQETRSAIDQIIESTAELFAKNPRREVLTVDNHVDGVYLYLKLQQEAKRNPGRQKQAEEVLRLLCWNGGGLYSSGVGIGAIDSVGNVHPDQFWQHYSPGNVRLRPFSVIWQDEQDPILYGLRHRRQRLKGRCRLCRWLDVCGGSLRVRADLIYGDPWAPDPACYLTDDEIELDCAKKNELIANNEIYPVPEFLLSSRTRMNLQRP